MFIILVCGFSMWGIFKSPTMVLPFPTLSPTVYTSAHSGFTSARIIFLQLTTNCSLCWMSLTVLEASDSDSLYHEDGIHSVVPVLSTLGWSNSHDSPARSYNYPYFANKNIMTKWGYQTKVLQIHRVRFLLHQVLETFPFILAFLICVLIFIPSMSY